MKKKAVDGCDVNGTFHTRFKATLSLNLGLDTRRKQVHALFGGMPIHPSFQMTPTSYSSGEVSSIQLLVMRGTKKKEGIINKEYAKTSLNRNSLAQTSY